jgi:hypothetical protein
MKVLGELKTAHTVHNGVDASYNFDASLKSADLADRSKDSTNVKDRVVDWERERERLREIGRLEDMEREREKAYKRKEKKRQKGQEKDGVVTAKGEEENDNTSVSDDLHRPQREVSEEKPRVINRKSASQLHIQIPPSSTQSIDDGANVGPRREAPTANHHDNDSEKWNLISSASSPVLPMFSTGPRLTQGKCLCPGPPLLP